ncbi:flagellar biosynthetic protein FliO [Caldibacillus lycopersici]|uniref:Flagellar biosynthetic protein FliO n=1 Tax=Perspicuibacillus lycopersici TaxID=1325689 RepID=A0AAE3IQ10_9BACI|nr:flagellar biosynthetic protein FliO [Perspicuibacillus lycopersici]MCU9612092.1 flagellar biosynthetic protein FliO [Perspicuibacillus lycopersici]
MQQKKLYLILPILILIFCYFTPVDDYALADDMNDSVADYFDSMGDAEKPDQTDKNSQSSADEASDTNSSVGITAWDVIKTIFALLFVVALLYIVLKWLQKKNDRYPSSQVLKNLGGTNLGPNRSVQLVKVGDSILVIGVGEDVQLLKEISDDEEVKNIIEQYNEKMDHMLQPKDIVSKVLERRKKTDKQESESAPLQQQFKQQLDMAVKQRREVFNHELEKGFTEE